MNNYLTCILAIDGEEIDYARVRIEKFGFNKLASGMKDEETRFFILNDDDEDEIYECDENDEYCLTIKLYVFSKIPNKFIELVNDYIDYDASKHNTWVVVDSNVLNQPKLSFLQRGLF